MLNPQYISNVKKGSTVTYGDHDYRIQDDKGWLHIIIKERGKRKKIGVKDLLFEYGSIQDYIFNGWFQVYSTYEIFNQFASSEIKWLES